MVIDNWSVNKNKETDFSIVQEDDFKVHLKNEEFSDFLNSLKYPGVSKEQINNAVKLLENYRTVLNFIATKSKVGALTEIENLVNKNLGM